MANKNTKKDGAQTDRSEKGMFKMPSGLTHYAQSSAGELYVHLPEPNKIEDWKGGATAHGKNKVNGAQLKGLFSNKQEG